MVKLVICNLLVRYPQVTLVYQYLTMTLEELLKSKKILLNLKLLAEKVFQRIEVVAIHYQKNIIFKKMIEILFSKKSFLKEEPYKSENFEKIIKKFAHSNSNSTLVTTNNLINICDQISFNWSSDESKIKKSK